MGVTQEEQIAAREHACTIKCEDVLYELGLTKEEVQEMSRKYKVDITIKVPLLLATEGK